MFQILNIDMLHDYLATHGDLAYAKLEKLSIPAGLLPAAPEAMFVECEFHPQTVLPENMSGAAFIGCRLHGLRLQGVSLFGAHFVGCDLDETLLSGCDLSAAQFSDCTLKGAIFRDCDLDTAHFSGSVPHSAAA